MNWQMIGAMGEFVGAIAVVLTLFYLARQIRHSALQDRRSRSTQLQRDYFLVTDAMARDSATADIFLRGLADAEALTPTEYVRFGALLFNLLKTMEALFQFSLEGGVHDYQPETWEAGIRDVVVAPGAQAWWRSRRHWFSDEFQTEVERWIAEGAEGFLKRYEDGPATDQREQDRRLGNQ